MNEQDTPNPIAISGGTSNEPHPSPRLGHRRSRRGFVTGLVLGTLGAGLVGYAIGATMPVAEAALGAASRRMGGGPATVGQAQERAEFFVGFALHRLDATADQEVQVQTIVAAAIDEFFPIIEKHRANRDQFRAILKAPTIDRAAIERLRFEELALADTLSRIIADTVADSAEVLTVEQRGQLLERLERFRHDH